MSIPLTRYGRELSSIFQLLGHNEDDLTYALGWCLANCSVLMTKFVEEIGFQELNSPVHIALQEADEFGRTDVEIHCDDSLLVIEAKKGFVLPTIDQLKKYSYRHFSEKSNRRLLVLTDYNSIVMREDANVPHVVNGLPIQYLGWQEIFQLVLVATKTSNNKQKLLLRQFATYLKETVTMPNKNSNLVWVVPLSNKKFGGGDLSFSDIVQEKEFYFHPIRKGYVLEPPNYIGFRHQGKLRSIHHIEKTDVFIDFHKYLDGLDEDFSNSEKHFLYHLGPAMIPQTVVKTGKIYGPGRHWAMLDLLLTSETVKEARDKTQERLK